jgi:hypothetical protein
MSAAFSLDFSGAPVPCSYPRCTLEAFHEGDHQLPPKPKFAPDRIHKCSVCGISFVIYGEADSPSDRRICDKAECLLELARREATAVSVMCRCPQREYPHELSIHAELKREAYNPNLRYQWPWSLMLSQREEPSTERREA